MALQCIRIGSQRQLSKSIFRDIFSPQLRVITAKGAFSARSISENEDFDVKNARLKRPQSPHLTIYKPQLTSLLSFTHRTTGMTLGMIVTAWGIGGLFLSGQFSQTLVSLQEMHLSPALILIAKASLALPLCYHYANGIRHLAWDMGKFLTIKEVYLTGYSVLIISILSAAFLASL